MTPARTQLVAEYLHRLDNACALLPPPRRRELRQEIREHIDAAMDEEEVLDADTVRAILERLGPPADIVAAELRTTPAKGLPAVPAGHLPAVGDRTPPPAYAPPAPAPGPDPHGAPATEPPKRPGSTVRAVILGAAAASAVLLVVLFSSVVLFSGSSGKSEPPLASFPATPNDAPSGGTASTPPPFTSPPVTASSGPAGPWTSATPSGTPSGTP